MPSIADTTLIERLTALAEHLSADEWGNPITAADDVRKAIRAVRAWKIAASRQWKAAPFTACGAIVWRAIGIDGNCEPGRDWPDPITAIEEAEAARIKLES
jgi:hypothetical protein